MQEKKEKAIVLGATGNIAFAVANVLLGIKKHSSRLNADIFIFYNDFAKKDMDLINSITTCQFVEYVFPQEDNRLENSFKNYSKLTFCRYECFKMLEKYKKVLWLDSDILIQKDISEIFDYAKTGISLYQESTPLQNCFSRAIEGINMNSNHYNAGILLIADIIPNYQNITEWLYQKTSEYALDLRYADQGIINIMIQEYDLEVDNFPEKFNCHPTKKTSKNSCIVHSYSPQKFWSYYEKQYHFREWDKNYNKWIKMGGTPYSGLKYDFWEKVVKSLINHECPHPIRRPWKFISFLLERFFKND